MTGVGTLANTAAIVVGGVFGLLLGKRLKPRFQETIVSALAVSVMFVGFAVGASVSASADRCLPDEWHVQARVVALWERA